MLQENFASLNLGRGLPVVQIIYRRWFKNWDFDKEAAQNFSSGTSDHCLWQGTSEDKNFDAKPTPSKTNF